MSEDERAEEPVNTKGGFWSFETLKNNFDKVVFGNTVDECLKEGDVSYRLHVGPEIYVSPRSPDIDPRLQTRRELKGNEAAEIPPGQFAFLTTLERVKIPKKSVGLIGLRAKQVKFKGLVNVSGFHADPGFHGHLIFAVFNAGPASIHVGCGDPWFQLMLADLDNGEHTERSDEFREGRPIIGSEMLGPIRG
jgi:dCTP deaminase